LNQDVIHLLAASPLFAEISADELTVMLGCLRPKLLHHPKNSFIAVKGDPFSGLGILLAGKATITKENITGSHSVLTVLKQGDLFGETLAFSLPQVWPASIFAQSDCSVAFLPSQKIIGVCPHACAAHHRLIRNLLFIVSEKASSLNRKVEYLTIRSMRIKIATYLLELSKIHGKKTFILPLKRDDLAAFLNVSRTALSRELGRMRAEGLIDFFRSSVKIQDMKGLENIAE
jgi:CRP-like cAMP-binding protein